jgi:tetratricopeptide (TPR) repeat protein
MNPNLANAHFNIGNIYGMSGKMEEASASFLEALKIQPRNPEFRAKYMLALTNLAGGYIVEGKYENAISVYARMIEARPDDYAPYYNIARICAKQNKTAEAIVWLEKAVALGFADWDFVKNDEFMAGIRDTSYYKQHIPEAESN